MFTQYKHTDTHKPTHTQSSFYTQKPVHTKTFTHRSFYTQTLLHTEAFTRRSFYTQTLLHTDAFPHRNFYTQTRLHTEAFTHRRFYTQMLLHTEAITQSIAPRGQCLRSDMAGPSCLAPTLRTHSLGMQPTASQLLIANGESSTLQISAAQALAGQPYGCCCSSVFPLALHQ